MAEFDGIKVAALDFYEDLENDNSRTFWLAHKSDYDELVRAPMTALVGALEPEFGTAKIFRPHRDVRFSGDKRPYKTHQGAFVATGEATGFYVQVDAAGLSCSAGWYAVGPTAKQRFREAVDHRRRGRELAEILDRLVAAGYELVGDRVKTQPRGWPADHPRIELLRHNTLSLRREHGAPPWLGTPETLERVRADWRALTPLLEWHQTCVAT